MKWCVAAACFAAVSFCANAGDVSKTTIVGLLGGFEKAHDPHRGVRKLILKLQDTAGVDAESFSNHKPRQAMRYILQSLDANHDGKLDGTEKTNARVILFGQSLGGSRVVALARGLRKKGIPVLLTVQIDSVGLRDGRIPDNVRSAANFYQKEILTFRGEDEIRATDPAKTTILLNQRFFYPPLLPSYSKPESWARRKLGGAHAKLEADPILWAEVEMLIRGAMGESILFSGKKGIIE
ncbi:hypothetical protein F183_A19540 [Bryobacterales bacterium F-183]|nr:hypothetical protein F183_A19540 [Bryobacterales bacterium F-183]